MSSIAAGQPWLIEVPAAEEKKEPGLWDQFQTFHALSKEVGGLIQPSIAAAVLDLSRARVCQFMNEGRFTVHELMGSKFLETREVKAFAQAERKTGRPVTFKAQMKRALAIGEEIGEETFGKK